MVINLSVNTMYEIHERKQMYTYAITEEFVVFKIKMLNLFNIYLIIYKCFDKH